MNYKLKHKAFLRNWQWRIQDFPDGGAPTSKVGALTYYLATFLLKTAWKWKNLDREGGARVPGAPPWIRQWLVQL